MKLAIYGISKNESKNVDRFMKSVIEADGVFISDTGSTDDTVARLEKHGAHVQKIHINPWRFDVARNISLAFVPDDYDICLCVDLDEVLTPGWCQAIKDSWVNIDRLKYPYVWSHLEDGSPGTTFLYDKCHSRNGFRWIKPVHEILQFSKGNERIGICNDVTLHHYQEPKESRQSYIDLLELGCKEDPHDDRNSHYLGREYMFRGRYEDCIKELKRHLSLEKSIWSPERAASMRYIGRCFVELQDRDEALKWFLRAVAEDSNNREPWFELGKFYFERKDYASCLFAMNNVLRIINRPLTYICEPDAWSTLPYDLAGQSAYQLEMYDLSINFYIKGLELCPNDSSIRNNLQITANKIKSNLK